MKVTFYFDYLSPYSYLAWQWVRELASDSSISFEICPVMMGPLIHAHNVKGPAEIPPKRDYLLKEAIRFAVKNEIRFTLPGKLPFISMEALRLSLPEVVSDQEKQIKLISSLFDSSWSEGKVLEDMDVLEEAINRADLSADLLFEKSSSKIARAALKQNGKRALEDGAFGVPTLVVTCENRKELFWGNDSKENFYAFIEGRDSFDSSTYEIFQKEFERNESLLSGN